jgi:hypothetical protein
MAKTADVYIRTGSRAESDDGAYYLRHGTRAPNAETLKSVKEGAKIIKSGKTRFDDAESMLRELKA